LLSYRAAHPNASYHTMAADLGMSVGWVHKHLRKVKEDRERERKRERQRNVKNLEENNENP
jgi:hypothetical protein